MSSLQFTYPWVGDFPTNPRICTASGVCTQMKPYLGTSTNCKLEAHIWFTG